MSLGLQEEKGLAKSSLWRDLQVGFLGKHTFCTVGSPAIQHQGSPFSSCPPLSQSRGALGLPGPSGLWLPPTLCTVSGQTGGRGPGTVFVDRSGVGSGASMELPTLAPWGRYASWLGRLGLGDSCLIQLGGN